VLKEVENTSQDPGQGLRRWFSDPYFDLIVWEDDGGNVLGFQLCYGKGMDEHAFTWKSSGGFMHHRVDDGEVPGMEYKSSPILVADGHFNPSALAESFAAQSNNIDARISELVYKKLLESAKHKHDL
jgi:hypothetical protein